MLDNDSSWQTQAANALRHLALNEEAKAYVLARSELEVMISAEGTDRTDMVLDVFAQLRDRFPNVGITIQAYLHRSPDDLQRVLELGGRVRIVKGAFEAPRELCLARGEALNQAYLGLVRSVVAARNPLSIATHDESLIRQLPSIESDSGAAKTRFELEMMYGAAPSLLETLHHEGYPTRVYLPYGREWHLYLCNRIAEHPDNIFSAIVAAASAVTRPNNNALR